MRVKERKNTVSKRRASRILSSIGLLSSSKSTIMMIQSRKRVRVRKSTTKLMR